MSAEQLPTIVQAISEDHPELWSAYKQLGEAVAGAGPLEPKTQRLVKLAIAVGARLEGAAHSHARRGLAAGITPQELRHVAFLAISTVGWPSGVAGLSWIQEEIRRRAEA